MNLSASSLFRFVTKFEYLKEIVTEGFGFRPCVEEMTIGSYENDIFHRLGVVSDELHSLAICFCDIPLSQSRDHRTQYGNYAIAMTKDWAMRNQVTPIRYYHALSPDHADETTRLMFDVLGYSGREEAGVLGVLRTFLSSGGMSPSDAEMESLPRSVQRLLSEANRFMRTCLENYWKTFFFTRVYEGRWVDRVTHEEASRRFYDEREWRAVRFGAQERLHFQFADIRHIIVNSDSERKELGGIIVDKGDELGVSDPTQVWAVIKRADELFPDV